MLLQHLVHRFQWFTRGIQSLVTLGCKLFQSATKHLLARFSEPGCFIFGKLAYDIQYNFGKNASGNNRAQRVVNKLVNANVWFTVEEGARRVWVLPVQIKSDFPWVLDYSVGIGIDDNWNSGFPVAFSVLFCLWVSRQSLWSGYLRYMISGILEWISKKLK